MKMKKNRAENFTTVEVDTVTGEFFVTIPQWILDERGWYEGTNLNIEVDGDCLIITDPD
jgi:bifunctional DNA-binding transcriptional regulator/antitoxin component of YhaV-PrlF toxin-antitoxin module